MKKYRKFRDYYNSKKNKKWRKRFKTLEKLYSVYGFSYFFDYEYRDKDDEDYSVNYPLNVHKNIINQLIIAERNETFCLKYQYTFEYPHIY